MMGRPCVPKPCLVSFAGFSSDLLILANCDEYGQICNS
jgi:hypothetical protein